MRQLLGERGIGKSFQAKWFTEGARNLNCRIASHQETSIRFQGGLPFAHPLEMAMCRKSKGESVRSVNMVTWRLRCLYLCSSFTTVHKGRKTSPKRHVKENIYVNNEYLQFHQELQILKGSMLSIVLKASPSRRLGDAQATMRRPLICALFAQAPALLAQASSRPTLLGVRLTALRIMMLSK